MKSRKEIKTIAKQRFYEHKWPSIGTIFLASMFYVVCAMSSLLFGPVLIGASKYCVDAYRGEYNSMKFEITGRKVGGFLWYKLFILLWAIPFFIAYVAFCIFASERMLTPTIVCLVLSVIFFILIIIKDFSYSMVTYILGDCPNVKATDALKISIKMMKGHKWQFFVYGLSFIGWALLSIITLGLVGVFFYDPYASFTYGGFYAELKNDVIEKGIIPEDVFLGNAAA